MAKTGEIGRMRQKVVAANSDKSLERSWFRARCFIMPGRTSKPLYMEMTTFRQASGWSELELKHTYQMETQRMCEEHGDQACRTDHRTCVDIKLLLRIAKDLKARPRTFWHFEWHPKQVVLDAFGDANWATCQATRENMSGGVIKEGIASRRGPRLRA